MPPFHDNSSQFVHDTLILDTRIFRHVDKTLAPCIVSNSRIVEHMLPAKRLYVGFHSFVRRIFYAKQRFAVAFKFHRHSQFESDIARFVQSGIGYRLVEKK